MHPWLLQLQPGVYGQLNVSSAAAGIPTTALDPASHSKGPAVAMTICPEGGNIRYRNDGTNPTAAVGMPVVSGDVITLSGHSVLKAFRGILSTGTTVLINYQLYHM
jgi:hypothetical protein